MADRPADTYWATDLLYWYLVKVKSQPRDNAYTKEYYDKWYSRVDTIGAINNRAKVYELLVDKPEHTNPSAAQVATSKIPWNQKNNELMTFWREWYRKLPADARQRMPRFGPKYTCGATVKVFFSKYMEWKKMPMRPVPRTATGVTQACNAIAASLLRKFPVRAEIDHRWHYLGIVGCTAAEDEFLCIEPWAGNTRIDYGNPRTRTQFLATVKRSTTDHTLEYRLIDGTRVTVTGYGNSDGPWTSTGP